MIPTVRDQVVDHPHIYNTRRPHRALDRRTPAEVFAARTKATPTIAGIPLTTHHRVRRDTIDKTGKVTLRYRSRLHHLGVGRRHAGTKILLLVADQDVRILTHNGKLIGHITIDPTRTYQPQQPT